MYDNARNKQFPSPWILYDILGGLIGFDWMLSCSLITGKFSNEAKNRWLSLFIGINGWLSSLEDIVTKILP